jgi:hypothetical protein
MSRLPSRRSAALLAAVWLALHARAQAAPARCGPPPASPVGAFYVEKIGGNGAHLTWWAQGGYAMDIVRGRLSVLAESSGDFGAAIERCLGEDVGGQAFDDPAVPAAGEGYWYLIRADQTSGCPEGEGTYNSHEGNQVGDRNVEIQVSGRDCACFLLYGSPGYCPVFEP